MELFPPQKELIDSGRLNDSRHLFISMPTGTGKTYLAEYAIEDVIRSGYKAIYLTPLRALAAQQYERFKDRFPNCRVGMFTGETIQQSNRSSYSKSRVLIMTPERLDACMRNWRSHWNWIPDVSLIIVDEFHLIGQPQRGPRLEGTLTRFIRLNPFARIIGLSATMPNTAELSDWLKGNAFTSVWRQVPLDKKIVRFKASKDKPELLLAEVRRCTDGGGQSIVFCNSRSRVKQISEYLNSNGIPSACHHAGLTASERSSIEDGFKSGVIRALAATSTLEMGLNLPARQVVIYDSYTFTDTGFGPLPVWNFIQRAGRAGRPGMDEQGEAVLLLPKWVGGADKYLRGECEPVNSMLTSRKSMEEQILIDVFAGYSRTRSELTAGFLPMTLYKKQHEEATLNKTINRLIETELLTEIYDAEDNHATLRCGLLGRLAVKLMLSPETVKLIKDAYCGFERLYIFDLLLIAAVSEDCSPVLKASWEEMDELWAAVRSRQSSILNMTADKLQKVLPSAPGTARLLAGIKMAAICCLLTEGRDIEEIAEQLTTYAADIKMLQESVVRILTGITAVISAIDREEKKEDTLAELKNDPAYTPNVSSMLTDMLMYEISSELVQLIRMKGVGGKTARKLAENGFTALKSLSGVKAETLAAIPGIGKKLAESIAGQAEEMADRPEPVYAEEPYTLSLEAHDLKTTTDPYRLRRSLELTVTGSDGPLYCVTGGREDHIVRADAGGYTCDCMDYEKNGGDCKHILCVKRSLNDTEVCRMIKKIREDRSHSIREALPSLWYSVTAAERDS